MKRKTILYALAIVAVGGACIAFYAYREFFRKHEDVILVESAYRLTAKALIQGFTDNEQNANKLYLGKVLTVSGMVKAIDNSGGLYTIALGDTTDLSSVRCSLDSLHNAEGSSLSIGSRIAVKGYCSGFNADELLGSDVILNRCAVETENEK